MDAASNSFPTSFLLIIGCELHCLSWPLQQVNVTVSILPSFSCFWPITSPPHCGHLLRNLLRQDSDTKYIFSVSININSKISLNINSKTERNLIIKVCDIIANDIQFSRFRSYSQNVAREMFLYSQKLPKGKTSLAFCEFFERQVWGLIPNNKHKLNERQKRMI